MSDTPTTRNIYEPAMHVRDQGQADRLFEALVHECIEVAGCSRAEAERIQRSNIGYYAGYFSHETRERVERLFACEHPYLGSIARDGVPTLQEAFDKGMALGKAVREREGAPKFTCPKCRAVSHNPSDMLHGYCGACHAFTGAAP